MAEIEITAIAEHRKNLLSFTSAEAQHYFENLPLDELQFDNGPESNFNISDLREQLFLVTRPRPPEPKIFELILREIILAGWVIPIILLRERVAIKSKRRFGKFGGEPEPTPDVKKVKSKTHKSTTKQASHGKSALSGNIAIDGDVPGGAYLISFDRPVQAIILGYHDVGYIIPTAEETIVVGFEVVPQRRFKHVELVSGLYTVAELYFDNRIVRNDVTVEPKRYIVSDAAKYGRTANAEIVNDHQLNAIVSNIHTAIIKQQHEIDVFTPGAYAQIEAMIAGRPTQMLRIVYEFISRSYKPDTTFRDPHENEAMVELLTANTPYSVTSGDGLILDVNTRGLFDLYASAVLYGIDDEHTMSISSELANKRSIAKYIHERNTEIMLQRSKAARYRHIIERKFPNEMKSVEDALRKNPILLSIPEGILNALPQKARGLVRAEFEAEEKYSQAVINNKCPHVRALRKFRTGISLRETFAAIEAFLDNPPKIEWERAPKDAPKKKPSAETLDDYIKCNSCKLPVMCPHVYTVASLELKGAPHPAIRAAIDPYCVSAGLISGGDSQYFCKICGETLEREPDDSPDMDFRMDPELRTEIFSEIATLMRFIKFGTTPSQLVIVTIRDAIYPMVFEMEQIIMKSKTGVADEIKARKRLYITIYALAVMIKMALAKEISFKDLKLGKNPIVDMIKHAVEIINTTRNIAIRNIPRMTIDIVRAELITAYKAVAAPVRIVSQTDNTYEGLMFVANDPIYHVILTMHMVLNARGKIVDTFDAYGQNIAKLLGELPQDLYANAKWPAAGALYNTLRGLDQNPYTVSARLLVDAYIALRRRLELKLHEVSVHVSSGMGMMYSPPHKKYLDEISKSTAESVKNHLAMKKYNARPIKHLDNGTRQFRPIDVPLSRTFDEDGLRHKWDRFVINVGGEVKTVSAKEIKVGEEYKVVEFVCSVCGIERSRTSDLDESKIRDSLIRAAHVDNFFRFYENRCPTGGTHEPNNTNCTKCNIVKFGPGRMNYFRKFRVEYERDRETFLGTSTSSLSNIGTTTKVKKDDSEIAAKYEKYTYNFNSVLDLANLAGVNHRLLVALGATERVEYGDIVTGVFIPRVPDSRDDTRMWRLDAAIKNLVMEYNQLRYYHRLVRPPSALTQLIEETRIDKTSINKMKLPDIAVNYFDELQWIRRHKKPREISDWILQQLCEICLSLVENTPAEGKALITNFVKYYIKKIVRQDELQAKPGYFNMSALKGERTDYDANLLPDEEERETADAPEDEAPLSMDAFDMEQDPDDDPDNDDNDINVGDDYGL